MKILVTENKWPFYKWRVIYFIFPLYKISRKENPPSLILKVVVKGNKRINYRRILFRDSYIPYQSIPEISDDLMNSVIKEMEFRREDIEIIGDRISPLADMTIKRELGI